MIGVISTFVSPSTPTFGLMIPFGVVAETIQPDRAWAQRLMFHKGRPARGTDAAAGGH